MLNPENKWLKRTGFVLQFLIGALFLFAGTMKVIGGFTPPPDPLAGNIMQDKLFLIGVGELVSAILLIFPWTSPLGTLLVSSLWGGIICFNMDRNENIIPFSVLLIVTWIAGYLRGSVPFIKAF